MFKSFVEKHEVKVHRFLEFTLGALTWLVMLSPIWLGILYPSAIVYFLTFLTVYWCYMAFKHSYGLWKGYKLYQKEVKVDWWEACKKLDFSKLPDAATLTGNLMELKHLLVIPAVNEPPKVFIDFVNSVLNQSFPAKNVVLAFTVEEKYAEQTTDSIKQALNGIEDKFSHLLFYVHPAGIAGEAKGDGGANRSWGAKHAVSDLKNMSENLRNYVFSNFDSDHVLHKEYLARLSYLYLSSDNRDNHFYSSAVPLFDNNLWRVPMMMRIEANAVTLGVLSDWAINHGHQKKTFSAFSTSLQTLIDADYFNVYLGADDTIFYWRAFFARKGNFDGLCHYIPYSADAVEGKNYMDSHRSLYKQLLRWGWGAVDFPLSITGFLTDGGEIASVKKIHWILRHIQDRVVLINIVFLITFGFGILTIVNPSVKQSSFAYSLPDIMSAILTLTLVCLLPSTYYRMKMSSPMPKSWSIWKKIIVYLEGPLIILNLLTFSFVPWIEAQTRMMFGKKMTDLYHTPKVR